MKIGIISFAHGHAYSYAAALKNDPGVEFIGLFDEDADRGIKAAQQFDTTFYASYEELLRSDVDAVIVTSENVKHTEHVTAAAKAKKHVLCEKPIAATVDGAQTIIDVCEQNEVILQVAFPVRFSTPVQRAKEMIAQGELGDILAVKATNRGTNPGDWFIDRKLSGGGAVLDHTVHVVDLLRWFMAAEVNEVYAEIGTHFTKEDIDDSGMLSMEFSNGVVATLDCSWSRNDAYPTWGDVTLEIIGTMGNLTVNAFDQKIDVYNNQDGVNWEFWGDDMDQGLVKDFLETVEKKRTPFITGNDGLKALEVALAAYQSAELKRTVRY